MKMMRLITKTQDPKIPEGMALIYIDDKGWVGTHNGWPHTGQPALYPHTQAAAIATAWNYVAILHPSLDEMPGRHCLAEATQEWFDIKPEGE